MKISDICSFKRNYPFDPAIKHNIISLTFFRLKNLYKDFQVYLYGLKALHAYTIKFKKGGIKNDIKIRLFYNQSIYQSDNPEEVREIRAVMRLILKNPHFQCVEYSCPHYKINDLFDRGIFPFFIRYLAFFDFEDNDTNYVYATDIDINESKKNRNYIEYLYSIINDIVIEKKASFYFLDQKCYKPFWRDRLIRQAGGKEEKGDVTLLGSNLGGNAKVDPRVLMDFLAECELTQKSHNPLIASFYKNYVEYICDIKIPEKYRLKKIITCKLDNVFVYGLDEFFITYFFAPHVFLATKSFKNIFANVRNVGSGGLFAMLKNLFQPLLSKERKINDATIRIYQSILSILFEKEIPSSHVLETLEQFIHLFEMHDYQGDSDNPRLYRCFHRLLREKIDNHLNKKHLQIAEYMIPCFLQNDEYYTDKNNLIRLTATMRKEYARNIGYILSSKSTRPDFFILSKK